MIESVKWWLLDWNWVRWPIGKLYDGAEYMIQILLTFIKWMMDPVKFVDAAQSVVEWHIDIIEWYVPSIMDNAFGDFVELVTGPVVADGISIGVWLLNQFCDAPLVLSALALVLTAWPMWVLVKTGLWLKGHVWSSSS